jgi:AcrR family transcriptional regulator
MNKNSDQLEQNIKDLFSIGLDVSDQSEYSLDGKAIHLLNDAQLTDIRNQKIGFVFHLKKKGAEHLSMVKGMISSANRRSDIVSSAIEVFAEIGYYRATTAQVAERAAISQPYVYRFFTKESLLVASLELSWQRILQAFQHVIDSAPPEELEVGLIRAYEEITISHRSEVLLQMQAQTIQETPVRHAMRQGLSEVKQLVENAFQQAGIEDALERTSDFLARGMLCNVAMAMDMPDLMTKR